MRPQFVVFGSSIVQYSYYEGWGATLSHLYARKVLFPHLKTPFLVIYKSEYIFSDGFPPPFEIKELGTLVYLERLSWVHYCQRMQQSFGY
jgi:hypothetical protein